jgi:hypothetical protein
MLACLHLFQNSSVSCSFLRSLTQCSSNERTGRHLVVGSPIAQPRAMTARPRRRISGRLLPPPISSFHSGFHLLHARRKNTPGGLAYQPADRIRLLSAAALYGPANFFKILHKNDIRSTGVFRGVVLRSENPYPSRTPKISSLLSFKVEIARISFPLSSH